MFSLQPPQKVLQEPSNGNLMVSALWLVTIKHSRKEMLLFFILVLIKDKGANIYMPS